MNTRRVRAPLLATTLLAAPSVPASDTDADCGAGGTRIKREKRAAGVCYGRASRDAAPSEAQTPAPVAPAPVKGERRERATQWLGDPDTLTRDALPGKEIGVTYMVTQDYPTGFECVIAGFEGHCVKL